MPSSAFSFMEFTFSTAASFKEITLSAAASFPSTAFSFTKSQVLEACTG